MENTNIYCYSSGEKSRSICRKIARSIDSVEWNEEDGGKIGSFYLIENANLAIIIADLNNSDEARKVNFLLDKADEVNTSTLVLCMRPIELHFKNNGVLDNLIVRTAMIMMNNELSESELLNNLSMLKHYNFKGFNQLSIELILAIKAIADALNKQNLIGVDFADYRLALEIKDLYRIQILCQEELSKTGGTKDFWGSSNVVISTAFLSPQNVFTSFSNVSTQIVNSFAEHNNGLLLLAPVIEDVIVSSPVIVMIYN